MKNEAEIWLEYADENLTSAFLLHDNELYNSSLQNCQQAVEKYLKTILLVSEISLIKTHSIVQLIFIVESNNIKLAITREEAELLDTIYLPSKYPVGNVLPDFIADSSICQICLQIADRVKQSVHQYLAV